MVKQKVKAAETAIVADEKPTKKKAKKLEEVPVEKPAKKKKDKSNAIGKLLFEKKKRCLGMFGIYCVMGVGWST